MRRIVSVLVILLWTALPVSGWSFTWTREDGNAYVVHKTVPVDCEKINQAAGQNFRWSPEEEGLSIWLFENDKCEGHRAGYSPPKVWDHISTRDLHSFRVAFGDDNGEPSTPTTTSTPTRATTISTSTTSSTTESTTTSASTPTVTPTETPGSDSDSDDSSTPAGAIAGGVVGGVAGLAAVAGLFYYLGRRRSQHAAASAPSEESGGPDPAPPPASASTPTPPPITTTPPATAVTRATSFEGKPELDSTPSNDQIDTVSSDGMAKLPFSPLDPPAHQQYHQPPARMMSELPGSEVTVEMSDSHRLNELEGDKRPKKM
ncbi:hypothetical protein BJX61DRAFT_535847 [Aspergillus egyptiacus]|nr:hypothetical protein BJX61DRAFT_535847 [Aspergillus egyptiacus]